MSRAVVVAGLCAAALALAAPAASASRVSGTSCVVNATWSLTSTTATVDFGAYPCYSAEARAALAGALPEWGVGGGNTVGGAGFKTYTYTPIVGFCEGTLSRETPTMSSTGVLKNEGSFHTVVSLVHTSKTTPVIVQTSEHVGIVQPPCSTAFQTTAVSPTVTIEP